MILLTPSREKAGAKVTINIEMSKLSLLKFPAWNSPDEDRDVVKLFVTVWSTLSIPGKCYHSPL